MQTKTQDKLNWLAKSKLMKYHEDITPFAKEGKESEFHELYTPYEVIEQKGNCLLNVGINEIWDLVSGVVSGAAHIFDNANSRIGVGDSTVAADPTQTDLQASTNKYYKGMETGFPTSTNQKITFKSSFGADEANFSWNEWVVKQATSAICLNRKQESLGTKSGGTWTLQVDIQLS